MLKNIIVAGGLGFIGSNLIDLLIKKKYLNKLIKFFGWALGGH